MSALKIPVIAKLTNIPNSLDDEPALQQKVTEALSVYDDYVKNKDGPTESGEAAPTNGEAPKQEESTSA